MTATDHQTNNRTRQSLRLDPGLYAGIDRARLKRPGNVSRNTWITEAIQEKLERENKKDLPLADKASNDV